MPPVAGSIQIQHLVVHEIPHKSVPNGKPTLSDVESPLNAKLASYFAERIAGSLGISSTCIVFDAATKSPTPALVKDALGPATVTFIDRSRQLANHLHNVQTQLNPEGLITVIDCTVGRRKATAILKLEKEAGVQVRRQQVIGGMTLQVIRLDDLMLTQKTRVFKVALFIHQANSKIGGEASDTQTGNETATEVARFFLRDFLGCKYCRSPEVTTEQYFLVAQDLINDTVEDPVARAGALLALITDLSSASDYVDPLRFANQHLPTNAGDAFIQGLVDQELPKSQFHKDTKRIASRLRKVSYDLDSGIVVFGPKEAMAEHATVTKLHGDQTRITITDRLKRTRARG